MTRTVRPVRILIGAVVALSLVPLPGRAAELAPNPGFERWAAEAVASAPVASQPLLPEGWTFEGATILFDHETYATNPDNPKSKRAIAISGSLSGKREVGLPAPIGFVDNPTNPAKDALFPAFSLPPAWRTAQPVAVKPGATYKLSVYTTQSAVTEDPQYGAFTFVRWVDANGAPISVAKGPSRPWRTGDPVTEGSRTAWEKISGEMKAPSAARGAILLLAQADDLWISQVIYDDVSFTCVKAC